MSKSEEEIEAINLECKKEFAHVDEVSRKLMKEKDERIVKQYEDDIRKAGANLFNLFEKKRKIKNNSKGFNLFGFSIFNALLSIFTNKSKKE